MGDRDFSNNTLNKSYPFISFLKIKNIKLEINLSKPFNFCMLNHICIYIYICTQIGDLKRPVDVKTKQMGDHDLIENNSLVTKFIFQYSLRFFFFLFCLSYVINERNNI